MRLGRFALLLAALTCASASFAQGDGQQKTDIHPAPPEKQKKSHSKWMGIEVGAYIPNDSTIRDVYGTGLKVGISPTTRIRHDHWHLDGDFGLIADNHYGNKLLIVTGNAAYERAFGPDSADSQPFVRFSGGLAYNDHSFNIGSAHYSNKTVGPDAAVEVGTMIRGRWRLSARYNLFSKSDDFEFSGITLSLQYWAFKY